MGVEVDHLARDLGCLRLLRRHLLRETAQRIEGLIPPRGRNAVRDQRGRVVAAIGALGIADIAAQADDPAAGKKHGFVDVLHLERDAARLHDERAVVAGGVVAVAAGAGLTGSVLHRHTRGRNGRRRRCRRVDRTGCVGRPAIAKRGGGAGAAGRDDDGGDDDDQDQTDARLRPERDRREPWEHGAGPPDRRGACRAPFRRSLRTDADRRSPVPCGRDGASSQQGPAPVPRHVRPKYGYAGRAPTPTLQSAAGRTPRPVIAGPGTTPGTRSDIDEHRSTPTNIDER